MKPKCLHTEDVWVWLVAVPLRKLANLLDTGWTSSVSAGLENAHEGSRVLCDATKLFNRTI